VPERRESLADTARVPGAHQAMQDCLRFQRFGLMPRNYLKS
jgi:hypothetical protein